MGSVIHDSATTQHFNANNHRHNIMLTKSKQSKFKAKCSRLSTVAVLSVSRSCCWAPNAAVDVIPTIVYISKESEMLWSVSVDFKVLECSLMFRCYGSSKRHSI